ncbi:hypothetical protein [Providencia rettgeri]|uniref:hypothetical protein n=1 Tax=Providencia rettgeri TaxID=587 RepID=UPI0034E0A889
MISEVTFSKKFTSFWNEVLPNAKNYVRLINGGLLKAEYSPFPLTPRKQNIALINTLSFYMLRELINQKTKFDLLSTPSFLKGNEFKLIMENSLEYLSNFSYGKDFLLPLNNDELTQVNRLFKLMYNHFIKETKSICIDPCFDGCGFINPSYGDLIHNDTLTEIKSGERKFSLTDIRQIVIYLTLNHYSNIPYKIERIELFNPRMGISFSEDVESFCLNISALSCTELYSEIQKYVTDNNFIEEYAF